MNAPADHTAAQELAEQVRDKMLQTDAAAHAMGLQIVAMAPGESSVTMTVRPDMLNGFGICQGGLISMLADTAFAYACNSFNEVTVASGFEVSFLAPARTGDTLTASARMRSQTNRTGVYDVEVLNQAGEMVALFRGRSYRLKGKPVIG
jgi:acyl-CoA thioesterase